MLENKTNRIIREKLKYQRLKKISDLRPDFWWVERFSCPGCVWPLLSVFYYHQFNQQEAPVRTVRKRCLTSEVAENVIEILQSTPAEILPAPCYFIVDHFNSRLKSLPEEMLESFAGWCKDTWSSFLPSQLFIIYYIMYYFRSDSHTSLKIVLWILWGTAIKHNERCLPHCF